MFTYKPRRAMIFIISFFSFFGFAILLWALIPASTAPFLDASGKPEPRAIAAMKTVTIGGVEQFLLLRGRDVENPVLLYLHGGPGGPETGMIRRRLNALEDHFTVAYWDQRGAGRSFTPEVHEAGLTPELIVKDTHEVVDYLRDRFHRERIFLLGLSWGTYLGAREAADHPEGIAAYIAAGQLVSWARNEAASYEKVLADARSAGKTKAVDELEALGPPKEGRYQGGMKGLQTQRAWVMKLGGSIRKKGLDELAGLWRMIFPEHYSLGDSIRWIRGVRASMSMVENVSGDAALDLFIQAPRLDVPAFFVTGRHDGQTPLVVLEDYFEQLQAPRKELHVFEDSAHLALIEEDERFLRLLVEVVRPAGEARGGTRSPEYVDRGGGS